MLNRAERLLNESALWAGLKIHASPVRIWALARRSGGMVDAAVSKTVGGQLPCRFESDLRHKNLIGCQSELLPSGVVVARGTLDPQSLVRIQARQLFQPGYQSEGGKDSSVAQR